MFLAIYKRISFYGPLVVKSGKNEGKKVSKITSKKEGKKQIEAERGLLVG